MKNLLYSLCLSICLLPCASLNAAEIDTVTDLRLRCGVGYLLIADMPEMNNTAEEAAAFKRMADSLLNHADNILAKQGVSVVEREEIGRRYTMEMDEVLTKDLDLGFEPESCPELVAEADAAALEAEINKHMTCGVGFLAAARAKHEGGETKVAADLEALGNQLANRGDDLMVEAGYNDAARFQIGQLYGESIGAKFNAGEDLEYDWDTCAALGQ